MDIHKPKPVHNWREFPSEIGVIVCGVLIALGLEQAVEALHWARRVHEAKVSIHKQMLLASVFAEEQRGRKGAPTPTSPISPPPSSPRRRNGLPDRPLIAGKRTKGFSAAFIGPGRPSCGVRSKRKASCRISAAMETEWPSSPGYYRGPLAAGAPTRP